MSRKTFVEINLENLNKNICFLKSKLKPTTKFMAVVKANAYGHGMTEVSKYIEHERLADYLAVAISDEAIKLRESNVTLPILILGLSNQESYADIIKYNNIIPTVTSINELEEIYSIAHKSHMKIKVHLKIDTGMNRIGFKNMQDLSMSLQYIKEHSDIILDGVFTHFAMSDVPDDTFTVKQYEKFMEFVSEVKKNGFNPIVHCANSGAILNHPEFQCDMVRGGISMYGYNPNSNLHNDGLSPVLSWKTSIVHIKEVFCNETISYGRTFKADKDMMIATLPVGYGDGFSRKLSNTAYVLISGHKCRVLGTVCMDQIMCDVTGLNPKIGDEVVLIGKQFDEVISADLFANWSETISYEVLLDISERVPRYFI